MRLLSAVGGDADQHPNIRSTVLLPLIQEHSSKKKNLAQTPSSCSPHRPVTLGRIIISKSFYRYVYNSSERSRNSVSKKFDGVGFRVLHQVQLPGHRVQVVGGLLLL